MGKFEEQLLQELNIKKRHRVVYAKTRAPAVSATCHVFRLLHWMLCSRPHLLRPSQQATVFESGQMCTRIGGTAARPLFFVWFRSHRCVVTDSSEEGSCCENILRTLSYVIYATSFGSGALHLYTLTSVPCTSYYFCLPPHLLRKLEKQVSLQLLLCPRSVPLPPPFYHPSMCNFMSSTSSPQQWKRETVRTAYSNRSVNRTTRHLLVQLCTSALYPLHCPLHFPRNGPFCLVCHRHVTFLESALRS